jgi:hypothetical protein
LFDLTADFVLSVSLVADYAAGSLSFQPGPAALSMNLAPFFVGPKGETGDAASLSADVGNALRLGEDGGLYTPEPQLASAQW